ncbi:MAG: AIR synthase family protein [Candidatus Asgardarchaeia archaeon]
MKVGKIPPSLLNSLIFKNLGSVSEDVIIGPKLGEDAAVVKVNTKMIVVSTDPITGAVDEIGRLVVNVNANDIATYGVRPKFMLVNILLPEGTEEDDLKKIVEQMSEAAKKLGVSIIGGHSEVTRNVRGPTVVGFMIGEILGDRIINTGGAKEGDLIFMTKKVGIEGTAILSSDCSDFLEIFMDEDEIEEARSYREMTSVVKDGVVAAKCRGVHAMHDPTEGGVVGALFEMAEASGLGFEVFYESIPISEITKKVCEAFEIDPLRLISSGCMLIAVDPRYSEEFENLMKGEGIEVSLIGKFEEREKGRRIVYGDGRFEEVKKVPLDELWKALEKYRRWREGRLKLKSKSKSPS